MQAHPIQILYQDEFLVAVYKPEGILVHRGMGAHINETFLLQAVRDLVQQKVYPVHRLDRPTRGIVVFALQPESAHQLQKSWQANQVQKTYHAVVRGFMPQANGIIEEALDDPDSGILQEACTHWKLLESVELPIAQGKHNTTRLSLLEINPITGRYHQIRRHMSRFKHPIIGDTTHGDRHHNHLFQYKLNIWKLWLWATKIQFPHPLKQDLLSLELPLELQITSSWTTLKNTTIK